MSQEAHSKFRAKELAIVLSHYDLGAIHEIHSYRRGNTQSPKSVVTSEKGRFLLKKRAPGRDDPYRVAMAHEIQLYLAGKGFCVPKIIGTIHSNSSMLETHGGIYELFEYVGGENYEGTESATRSAGRTLRWLHTLLTGFTCSFQVPTRNYHDNNLVRKNMQELTAGLSKHESAFGREAELQSLIVELMCAYDEAAERVQKAGELNNHTMVCHGDWHPGNMIFREGQVVAVVDFDGARRMPMLADVANGCLQFSLVARGRNPELWPDELDIARARQFLHGYQPDEFFDEAQMQVLAALMLEALIAEAITPIAATGMFAGVQGFTFLQMIRRKVRWMQKEVYKQLMDRPV